jgi:dTDP-4-dehydrorhamnose reductase
MVNIDHSRMKLLLYGMETVLVTGANGFIGWYLVRDLLEKSFKVVATGMGASRLPFQNSNLLYEPLDFTDANAVHAIFKMHTPKVVVHAGAKGSPDDCELNREAAFATNVAGTENLLNAAAACSSYFVFISTDFVFEGNSLAYKEDDTLNPVNYYGQTKLLAEAAVKKYVFGWSLVRTIMVYGKPMSGRQNLLTIVAEVLKKGERYRVFNDQTRMPTYVEDLSNAIATMVAKRAQGIFHICGKDVTTPYNIALAVARHLGYDAKNIEEATAATFTQPALRPPTTGFNLTKASNELSYNPISFAEGLQKTFGPLFPPRQST